MPASPPSNSTLGIVVPSVGPPSFRYFQYRPWGPGRIVKADVKPFLGLETGETVRELVKWHNVLKKEIPYTLELRQVPGKQEPNSFVSSVVEGASIVGPWEGSMVILAYCQRYAVDDPVWRDAGCDDLRWMMNWWRNGDEPLSDETIARELGLASKDISEPNGDQESAGIQSVQGVMIACEVERKLTGKTFMEVDIGTDHPIWKTQPTQISVEMDLPILMYSFPLRPMGSGSDESRFKNPEATAMSRIIKQQDPDSENVESTKALDIGTVLIVRKDKKDVDAKQAELLATYCIEALKFHSYAFNPEHPKYSKALTKDGLLDKIAFHVFFELQREEWAEKDRSWLEAKSPYQV